MFAIDAFQNTLAKAVDLLQGLGVRFHLTGGITSVAYGEPRMTQDVDLVVENATLAQEIDEFLKRLTPTDLLFEEKAIRSALKRNGMFRLYDTAESLKLDIYARELIPGELNRSVHHEVFEGVSLPIVSLADAAASKLVWISKGSHKSRRDLRQLMRRANDGDKQAVSSTADQFGLTSLLHEVLDEPDEILD